MIKPANLDAAPIRGAILSLPTLKTLRADFPSSVVVFLVALPLCLGVALASGAPLFSGVIAGIVGGIVVGGLSKSPLSVSGPAAGLTVIVFAAIQRLPSFDAFLLAVMLAGVIQIALAATRSGVAAEFVPQAQRTDPDPILVTWHFAPPVMTTSPDPTMVTSAVRAALAATLPAPAMVTSAVSARRPAFRTLPEPPIIIGDHRHVGSDRLNPNLEAGAARTWL